jgi:hypothetical protein
LPIVKEHATPLAGAGVETGLEVHATSDVADKAASGGCVSRLVVPSSIPGVEVKAIAIHRPAGGHLYQIETTDEAETPAWDGVGDECLKLMDSWELADESRIKAVLANLLLMLPDHEAMEVIAYHKKARSLREIHQSSGISQRSPDGDQTQIHPDNDSKSLPC